MEEDDTPRPCGSEKEVRSVESVIRQNPLRHANDVLRLLSTIRPPPACTASVLTKAIHATRRSLTLLHSNASSPKLEQWVNARLLDFSTALTSVLQDASLAQALHDTALASAALAPAPVFEKLVEAAVNASLAPAVATGPFSLLLQFVRKFSDLSKTACDVVRKGIDTDESRVPHRYLALLFAACESAPRTAGDIQLDLANSNSNSNSKASKDKLTLNAIRSARTRAWKAVLQHSGLTIQQRVTLTSRLATHLLPFLTVPALELADFLKSSFDASATYASARNPTLLLGLSIASLDALFILVSQHHLDYPNLYHKLYALLSPVAFTLAHEHPRFFTLLAQFTVRGGQRTLSRTLAAAFIKRLIRRAVHIPTPAALFCVRLALELLRAYPATTFLVHTASTPVNFFDNTTQSQLKERQKQKDTKEEERISLDPFDDAQDNPEKANVEATSLWELDILRKHFSPNVSRLVTLFDNDMRAKPPPLPGQLADYSALHFDDLMQAEMRRKAKSGHMVYDAPGTAEHSVALQAKLSPALSWT